MDNTNLQRIKLPFLINHKFGILPVFLVSAYRKKIHVRGDPKTSAAEFTFKLTPEVCLLIKALFSF